MTLERIHAIRLTDDAESGVRKDDGVKDVTWGLELRSLGYGQWLAKGGLRERKLLTSN